MVPLAVLPSVAPLLAIGDSYMVVGIIVTTIATIVCSGIVLTTGAARGHVVLGIIFALLTVPASALGGCLLGLPVALIFATILKFLPPPNRPLLSQAEVEQEMRRVRGY
jgi:hypothetical protein